MCFLWHNKHTCRQSAPSTAPHCWAVCGSHALWDPLRLDQLQLRSPHTAISNLPRPVSPYMRHALLRLKFPCIPPSHKRQNVCQNTSNRPVRVHVNARNAPSWTLDASGLASSQTPHRLDAQGRDTRRTPPLCTTLGPHGLCGYYTEPWHWVPGL